MRTCTEVHADARGNGVGILMGTWRRWKYWIPGLR